MNITYDALIEQVKSYHPGKYPVTRNYTNGAVTNWSPYISRGLLSPVLVMEQLKTKHNKQEWIGFMQQMAWREYFQRVWQEKGDLILQDLKSTQSKVILASLPKPINAGNTGIQALDNAIHHLYAHGMMHNHVRMYISMLHSNIFKAAWLPGAKWMYANLLDHDPAANFLSWQWVAGTFSSKQYIANQENINKYTNTKQLGTFLDREYEFLQTSIFDQSKRLPR
jgi:deoxyribodipyrimidine photo-lyase